MLSTEPSTTKVVSVLQVGLTGDMSLCGLGQEHVASREEGPRCTLLPHSYGSRTA